MGLSQNTFFSPNLQPHATYVFFFVCFLPVHLQEGEFRGVMSWGSEPQDLDFHDLIFTQLGVVECEVYYSNKECGNVNLDIDNTNVSGTGQFYRVQVPNQHR